MEEVEYSKINHKKKRRKPQKTRPHLEEPSTIVYADIRTSHIQLPVEDAKSESTGRQCKCRTITKILIILVVLTLCCCIPVLTYKYIIEKPKCSVNSGGTDSAITVTRTHREDQEVKPTDIKNQLCVNSSEEIKKQLCVNTSDRTAGCMLCPDGWLRHNESCYYYSSGGDYRTWNESREECHRMGAHLLVIEDPEQQKFINKPNRGAEDDKFWIGLFRDGDGWRWVDTQIYNTGLSQISEESPGNCVMLKADSAYNKDDCQSKHCWICQKRALKISQLLHNVLTHCSLIYNTK